MSNGIYGYYDKEKEYVCYIGRDSHIDINQRNQDHYKPSNYNSQQINRVLQNNPNRYDYFILAEGNFSDDELNNMEKQAIKIFKTYHYDYPERSVFNFTKGGDFNPMKVPEIVQKLSEAYSGKNNPFYDKHHTEETKKKISENMPDYSGKNNPRYKNYARIIKAGFDNKKQVYIIKKDGGRIKSSISKEKLKKWFKKQYPDEELVDEL